jgi:hypothetical protein
MGRIGTLLMVLGFVYPAVGNVVMDVDDDQKYVVISHSDVRPWQLRDRVCIFRNEQTIACGPVVKVNEEVAKVKLRDKEGFVKKMDTVLLMRPSRAPASTVIGNALEVSTRERPTYNTLAGLNMSLELIFPKIELQGFLTKTIALGFQPAFARSSLDTGDSMFTIGFMFTLNWYSNEDYRGLWIQGASGLYIISNSISGTSVSTRAPVLQATIGWREQWAMGLNIGIGIGARYIGFAETGVEALNYSTFAPTLAVDIGFDY